MEKITSKDQIIKRVDELLSEGFNPRWGNREQIIADAFIVIDPNRIPSVYEMELFLDVNEEEKLFNFSTKTKKHGKNF